MHISSVCLGSLATNCYLIETDSKRVLVDPAEPSDALLSFVGDRPIDIVVLTHGHRPGSLGFLLKGLFLTIKWVKLTDNGIFNRHSAHRLARAHPDADIIIFGHSHRAHAEWIGNTLLVNPGAVVEDGKEEQPTVARMHIGKGTPEVEIIPLLDK